MSAIAAPAQCARIFLITNGSSMLANTFTVPLNVLLVSMSN
jgi:hypothetical protein